MTKLVVTIHRPLNGDFSKCRAQKYEQYGIITPAYDQTRLAFHLGIFLLRFGTLNPQHVITPIVLSSADQCFHRLIPIQSFK